ncbi:NAD-dependent epimerase/dehydratase family protein [Natrinema pallidum]|uniref:NAD-dependent epimerase/dehydratase family protein n=1 Tax=Natrinema pallidum TaxID=69527 RepID=UPI0037429E62
MVEQAREDGCETVVYASTSSIYGSRTESSPVDMDISINTGDEASKLARERYGEYFANHYDMSIAGMRFLGIPRLWWCRSTQRRVRQRDRPVRRRYRQWRVPVLYGAGTQTRGFLPRRRYRPRPRVRGRQRTYRHLQLRNGRRLQLQHHRRDAQRGIGDRCRT